MRIRQEVTTNFWQGRSCYKGPAVGLPKEHWSEGRIRSLERETEGEVLKNPRLVLGAEEPCDGVP